MNAGETIHFKVRDEPLVAVVQTEWFHSENPPPRERPAGTPWNDLTVLETAKGAFVVRIRARVKEPASSVHSVTRVRTIECDWYCFDNRERAIEWFADDASDASGLAGKALAGRALARLRAEEV